MMTTGALQTGKCTARLRAVCDRWHADRAGLSGVPFPWFGCCRFSVASGSDDDDDGVGLPTSPGDDTTLGLHFFRTPIANASGSPNDTPLVTSAGTATTGGASSALYSGGTTDDLASAVAAMATGANRPSHRRYSGSSAGRHDRPSSRLSSSSSHSSRRLSRRSWRRGWSRRSAAHHRRESTGTTPSPVPVMRVGLSAAVAPGVGRSGDGGGDGSEAPDLEAHVIVPLVELSLSVQSDESLEAAFATQRARGPAFTDPRAAATLPLVVVRLKQLSMDVTQAGVDQTVEMHLRHMYAG